MKLSDLKCNANETEPDRTTDQLKVFCLRFYFELCWIFLKTLIYKLYWYGLKTLTSDHKRPRMTTNDANDHEWPRMTTIDDQEMSVTLLWCKNLKSL